MTVDCRCEKEMDTGSSHCDDVDSSRPSSVDTHLSSSSSSQKAGVFTTDKRPTSIDMSQAAAAAAVSKQYHNAPVQDSSRVMPTGGGVIMRERLHSAGVEATQFREERVNYRLSTPEVSSRHATSSVTSRPQPTPAASKHNVRGGRWLWTTSD